MMNPSPAQVRELVSKAFVLEALTDKPGCTTRYQDLPGKLLQDFVIAGINSSKTFEPFAQELKDNPSSPIFSHNLEALKNSNVHKSSKYINFGLLEIMFPVVAARTKINDPSAVIDEIIDLIKSTTNRDVLNLLATRSLAWSTSATPHKTGFNPALYENLESVWDFYRHLYKDFAPESSNFQWAKQYQNDLPILRAFFDRYTEAGEIMMTTRSVFIEQRDKNPAVAVGIIADMCAAAIFLWLSFNEGAV